MARRPVSIDLIFHREAAGGLLYSARSDHNLALAAQLPPDRVDEMLSIRVRLERALANEEPLLQTDLAGFGDQLAEVMFPDELGRLYNHAAGSGIRLSVCARDPDLKSIPWEFVRWPDVQACPHEARSVARLVTVSNTRPPTQARLNAGLRVMLVVSQPQDQGAVEWVETRAEMERIFNLQLPGKASLILQEAASPTAVREAVRAADPHIIHFIGHGTPEGLVFMRHGTSRSQLVPTAQLHNIFNSPSRRLVILSACDTGSNPGGERPLGSIAEQLVQAGAPAVVANQMPISLRSVAQFCSGLYRSLLATGNVDQAVNEGRISVGVEYDNIEAAAVEWGVPVLYRRPGCSQLFSVGAAA